MPNSTGHWRDGLTARACAVGAAVSVVLAVVAASGTQAESIWDRRDRASAFLYTDNVASDIGDSLTVLIADLSTVTSKGDRKLAKTTAASGSATIDVPLVDFRIRSGQLAQESSRTFEGSSNFKSTRQFRDSVTVTVMDKLPNGNLVVAGRSERFIDGDDVLTVLTGIVKPEDISGQNTVSSTRVAHANIYYETSGMGPAYDQRGWLNSILDLIWPF